MSRTSRRRRRGRKSKLLNTIGAHMLSSRTVVPYAAFLEARTRRARVIAEFARFSSDVTAHGAAPGDSPLTIDVKVGEPRVDPDIAPAQRAHPLEIG